MNLELSRKHVIVIILSIVILAFITVGVYFLSIAPVKQELKQKQAELKSSTQELTIIQNKLKQTNEQTIQSTMELQEQVPVKRLLDQLLLNVEKAETISDVTISEMKLNGTDEDEDELIKAESTATTEKSTTTDEKQTESDKDVALPNGIRKTSILMTGEASTYFEMEKFLTELLSLTRVIKIEQFNYTGPEEMITVDQAVTPLKFEVTIAAYYYPTLTDLQKELPPLDAPNISNKQNPISELSEAEGNDVNENSNNP